MTLTVRSATVTGATTKGSALTHAELDENFNHLSQASNISVTQSGSGAFSRPLQTHIRELFFNAKGYGSALATTPGADINQAITAANDAGGGTVLVPYGTWDIETAILHKSKVRLIGAGIGATVLQQATGYNGDVINQATSVDSKSVTSITHSSGTATVTITAHGYAVGDVVFIMGADQTDYLGAFEVLTAPTADTFTVKVSKDATSPATGTITCYKETNSDIGLESLTILGASAASGGSGVQYEGIHRFTIKDVEVRGTNEHAIFVKSGYKGEILNCGGHSVVTATHVGILLGASSPSPATFACAVDVIGCKASANGQDGILVEQGRDVRVMACHGWRNGQSGLKLGKGHRISFSGNTSWGNTTGINLQGQYVSVSVVGNVCTLNGDSGILVGNVNTSLTASGLDILGNVCDDNGQVASSTSYGIAFEGTASATVDGVTVVGNTCRNQGRGISFGTNGTFSNVVIGYNNCKSNTVDYNAGASLQTTTLVKGFNLGTAGSGSNALTYPNQIHRLNFSVDNLVQNATTALTPQGASARGFVMPEAGYIRRMYVKGNDACTAGSCTFQPLKNAVANANFNCVIDTTDTTTDSVTQAIFNQTFAAGDVFTAQAVANATFAPTGTTDYDVVLEVVY
jgi:hypothetical protein